MLLPCRRPHPTFLRAALTSVIGQSSGRWRLSVVSDPDDPASRREAEAALHELGAAADPRITLLVNEGRFITGAFNTGMRRAATPFVCALHGDDLLARRAIATVTRAITRSPAVDYLHSSRRYIDGDGAPLGRVQRAVAAFTLEDFVRRGPVKALHCWRVAAALAVGGMDETLGPHGADDYDFPWLMAEAGRAFQSIPQCLYYYRDHRHHYRLTTHVPLDQQVAEQEDPGQAPGARRRDRGADPDPDGRLPATGAVSGRGGRAAARRRGIRHPAGLASVVRRPRAAQRALSFTSS